MKKDFETLMSEIKNNTSPEFEEAFVNAQDEKKKINIIVMILTSIIGLFIIFSMFHSSISSSNNVIIYLFLLLVLLFIYLFLSIILNSIFSKKRNIFNKLFKLNIIYKLLNNFYDNVNYLPDSKMPQVIYDEAKYNEYYNEYYSDDYMEALINTKHLIKMAEIHTVDVETTRDSNGNTTTTRTTKFHGLFANIQMEKSINSELLIRRNHSFTKKHRLEMDSQEFEKQFDVSTTNNIISMQLLTHDIMELLVNFRKTTGITFDISIYNNILYLRFHTGEMFELKTAKNNTIDTKRLKKYHDILDFTYTLSNMLIELIEKTEI